MTEQSRDAQGRFAKPGARLSARLVDEWKASLDTSETTPEPEVDEPAPELGMGRAQRVTQRLFGEQPVDKRTVDDLNAELRERGSRHLRLPRQPRNRAGH